MRSLRTQLLGTLIPGVLLLSALAAAGLFAYVEEALEHELDAALSAKADAIAGAVHMEEDGQPHLRLADTVVPWRGMRQQGPFYYQLWRADGRTLARSAPGTAPLPIPSRPGRPFADATLADGTPARVTAVSFAARPDEDEFDPGPTSRPAAAGERLTLVVAHERWSEDRPLAVLLGGLMLMTAVMAGGIVVVVTWSVRRGLRPLAEVSRLADRIGPDVLAAVRFPAGADVPAELRPIGQKLNDLLDRLSAAFARERRFSAAVAHELRTPLAELRSVCEVALRWPDDRTATADAVVDALTIAREMGDVVHTLLALAKCQAGVEVPRVRPVALSALLSDLWSRVALAADHRKLAVDWRLQAEAVGRADPDMLSAVFRNLLGNAAAHAPIGGTVRIGTDTSTEGTVTVRIGNTTDGTLTADDVAHVFEPFWRKDAARTAGGGHAGLGLSLVDAYCRAMGVAVAATVDRQGWYEVTVRLSAVAEVPAQPVSTR